MLRVGFTKKNIILVNKLTYLLSGAFLSAKIVVLVRINRLLLLKRQFKQKKYEMPTVQR